MAASVDMDPCLAAAEVEEELDLLSGTITAAFSLQIQAELLLAPLPLATPHFLDLPFFPCQDQHCLPAAWLRARTGWAPLCTSEPVAAVRGLGLLWACAAVAARCETAPLSLPELCWGGQGWLWALALVGCSSTMP